MNSVMKGLFSTLHCPSIIEWHQGIFELCNIGVETACTNDQTDLSIISKWCCILYCGMIELNGLVYILKMNGPKNYPWVTPYGSIGGSENLSSIFIFS